jgi:hypothetical protein
MTSPQKSPPWRESLPQPVAQALPGLLSLLAGIGVAVMFHYLLYRLGLPSQPFIYVAF